MLSLQWVDLQRVERHELSVEPNRGAALKPFYVEKSILMPDPIFQLSNDREDVRRKRAAFLASPSIARLCGFHFNQLACRRRGRDWLSFLLQALQVEFDGIANERQDFIFRFAGRDASREIGNIRTKGRGTFFNDDKVSHTLHFSFLSPACFNTLFRVPGGMSMLAFPATVTVPFFVR